MRTVFWFRMLHLVMFAITFICALTSPSPITWTCMAFVGTMYLGNIIDNRMPIS